MSDFCALCGNDFRCGDLCYEYNDDMYCESCMRSIAMDILLEEDVICSREADGVEYDNDDFAYESWAGK